MNISFSELRQIKHSLPTGSVSRIARELNLAEQTVRNFFGAKKFEGGGEVVDFQLQPGPDGGIVSIQDPAIIDLAKKIIEENKS